MHDYDKTSKWLIQHYGDAILRIAGVRDVVSWRPLQAEVVQPRQLPDGLVEVRLAHDPEPRLFVLELATYPDQRLLEQVLRDMTLVYLDRRVLPEVLTLVLHPKGNLAALDAQELRSPLGWTGWRMSWKVITLWTIPAEDLLATGDLGVIPWVPLSRIAGPVEPVIQQCRARIDAQAPAEEHENFLAVTQILTRLRYNDPRLLAILGGKGAMLELPFMQEILADKQRRNILMVLRRRLGNVTPEITAALSCIEDEARLDELLFEAASVPDLATFQRAFATPEPAGEPGHE